MAATTITLKSSDGEVFEVEKAVAMMSQTIKHMIEDDCAASAIPLPNVTSKILSKVIDYSKRHAAAATDDVAEAEAAAAKAAAAKAAADAAVAAAGKAAAAAAALAAAVAVAAAAADVAVAASGQAAAYAVYAVAADAADAAAAAGVSAAAAAADKAVAAKAEAAAAAAAADKAVAAFADAAAAAAAVAAAAAKLKEYDAEFVKVDQATLVDLILAANYLHIKSLLDLTCQTVADMMKGKTPEEIRKTFNIKNDFTPEEQEEIRRENQWKFE